MQKSQRLIKPNTSIYGPNQNLTISRVTSPRLNSLGMELVNKLIKTLQLPYVQHLYIFHSISLEQLYKNKSQGAKLEDVIKKY